jgi:glucosamine--fructose-6-phosphate aminotransferase (isomerizing)
MHYCTDGFTHNVQKGNEQMSITTSEIMSQPDVWRRALSDLGDARRVFGRPGERILLLGCGTSEFISESLAVLRERAGLGESDAAYASEWMPTRNYDRVIAISRSGTTSEVLAALERVPAGVAKAGITGVHSAPIHDLVDDILVLDYADEESVVQTRFPTTVLNIGRAIFGEDTSELVTECEAALTRDDLPDVSGLDHFVYLSSGWSYGLAEEAALKIREAAQAWSESYPTLDYRHGPIAVAHPGSLVWIFGGADPDLISDIEATGALVRTSPLDPVIQLVEAQRLAVRVAESRGLDADVPRHLSRSVILR